MIHCGFRSHLRRTTRFLDESAKRRGENISMRCSEFYAVRTANTFVPNKRHRRSVLDFLWPWLSFWMLGASLSVWKHSSNEMDSNSALTPSRSSGQPYQPPALG